VTTDYDEKKNERDGFFNFKRKREIERSETGEEVM